MTDTAVQRFYRFHAYVYDATRWTILHGRRRAIDALQLKPESSVLEVGCGTGLNFRLLLDRLDPARGSLTGLDFSQEMLQKADVRVKRAGWANVRLVQGDATTMQLGRTFDAVLFAYSLTMIPDWQGALRAAHAHLKPGGKLVVLDFGRFENWGPLAPVMRAWLRSSHVVTLQPYADEIERIFGNCRRTSCRGGYYFLCEADRT